MQRCRNAEVQGRCAGAKVQRCRGCAEIVQSRCAGAEVAVQRWYSNHAWVKGSEVQIEVLRRFRGAGVQSC